MANSDRAVSSVGPSRGEGESPAKSRKQEVGSGKQKAESREPQKEKRVMTERHRDRRCKAWRLETGDWRATRAAD